MTSARKGRKQAGKVVSLSITGHKRRDMDARFRRDMRALRAQLPTGPQRGENRDQFVERVLVHLEAILTRYDPTLNRLLAPVRRGRPLRLDQPPKNPKGRPRKRTLETELGLLARIERRQAEVLLRRVKAAIVADIPPEEVKPLSDMAALRAEYTAQLIADGVAQEEARTLAHALTCAELRPICINLSRLRGRALKRHS